MNETTNTRLMTRLHAEVTTRSHGFRYANGESAIVLEVIYSGKPYEPHQLTLTAAECRELAGQLQAQADTLASGSVAGEDPAP